jgi:hypothetical protein
MGAISATKQMFGYNEVDQGLYFGSSLLESYDKLYVARCTHMKRIAESSSITTGTSTSKMSNYGRESASGC